MNSVQVRVDSAVSEKVRSHRDLLVWRKAMDLVDLIYDLAEKFPAAEGHRLVAQITREVVSVPANIAEGQPRSTSRDFANFLAIAKGSLMETETLLMIAVRRSYATETSASAAFAQITEISKMLTSLRSRLVTRGRKAR